MVCNTIKSVNTSLNNAEGKGHWGSGAESCGHRDVISVIQTPRGHNMPVLYSHRQSCDLHWYP